MAEPDRYERLLQSHVNVNPRSWAAMQLRGVDEKTSLQLDFEYTAPGEDETRLLLRHLRASTDYLVQGGARNQEDGSLRWLILGSTSPATWSLDRLNEWVAEMIAHGRDHGPAEFDGWGARTPESAPSDGGSALKMMLGRMRRKR